MLQSELVTNIIHAFRRNLVPGLFLQFFALTVCLCYYFWDPAKPVFTFFADLKTAYGPVYSFFSTSLFGGLIPFIYLALTRRIKKNRIKYLIFTCSFWALKGIEINYLYALQSLLFGDGNDVMTIVKKTCVDQFIYAPLLAVPGMTIAMLWPKNDFSWRQMKQDINKPLFTLKMPTILISNMIVWIPTVSIVYVMPAPLQVPVSNLALCFFVLILAVLTKNSD